MAKVSKQYPGQKIWPLPTATAAVLETVQQACQSCPNKQGDIFLTNLRQHGATAAAVSSVVQHLMPDLPDTASVTVEELMQAISQYQMTAQAA